MCTSFPADSRVEAAGSLDSAARGGALVFDLLDARAPPDLDLLFELLLVVRKLQLVDGLAGGRERNVVAGDCRAAQVLRHEVVEHALVAGVRAVRVAVVETAQRVLKDRGRLPGGAHAPPVAALLDEVQLGL